MGNYEEESGIMAAYYQGDTYILNAYRNDANVVKYNLITKKQAKAVAGFVKGLVSWTKDISMADELLQDAYRIRFLVGYVDKSHDESVWEIDENRPGGIAFQVEDGEIVIYSDKEGEGWNPCGKNCFSKRVNVNDCARFFIEYTYYKEDSQLVENPVPERKRVEFEEFWTTIAKYRRRNL